MSAPTIDEKWEQNGDAARFTVKSDAGRFTVNCWYEEKAAGFAGRRGGWVVTITPPGGKAYTVKRKMAGQVSIERHVLDVAKAFVRLQPKGAK